MEQPLNEEEKKIAEELLRYSKEINEIWKTLKEDIDDIGSIISTIKDYYQLLELVAEEDEFESIEELKKIRDIVKSNNFAELEKLPEKIKEIEAIISKIVK